MFGERSQHNYVSRKNKVTDNLVKIELPVDMDQASMKAFTQFHDKRF